MKKLTLTTALFILLCACAGEPPKWWNPSGKYGSVKQEKARPQVQAPLQKAATSKPEEIKEEDITPLGDDALEEVDFQPLEDNPLPQETPAEPGSAEQSAPKGTLAPSILGEQEFQEEQDTDAEDEE